MYRTIRAAGLTIGQTVIDEEEALVVAGGTHTRNTIWITFADGTEEAYRPDELVKVSLKTNTQYHADEIVKVSR